MGKRVIIYFNDESLNTLHYLKAQNFNTSALIRRLLKSFVERTKNGGKNGKNTTKTL